MLGSTEYGRFLAQEFPDLRRPTRAPATCSASPPVRYSGSWDVNPALQNSLLQGLKDNTGIDVDFTPHAVTLDDPQIGQLPAAVHDRPLRLPADRGRGGGAGALPAARRHAGRHVGGRAEAVRPRLPPRAEEGVARGRADQAAADASAVRRRLEPDRARHLHAAGACKDNPTLEYPEFYGLFLDGRLAVLYSPYDLMSGVNRESNAYAKGVAADDALRLVINIITYALSH